MKKEVKVNLKKKTKEANSFMKKYMTTKNVLTGVGILSAAGVIGYGIKTSGFKDVRDKVEKAEEDYKIPINIS
ncbi:hypothetical protein RCC89_10280 [Cytophagaceae bacterium ABcell3]|nr:hypothetical protein RCC89_10280 [Cytophagaceae bacterium ABcell3]